MYKTILVPIAFDHQGDGDAALKLAQLIREPGGEIILLNVVETIPAYLEAQLPKDTRARHHSEAVKFLEDIAQRIPGSVQTNVLLGNAGAQILEFAEENGCDCIIMLSHKPGLQDYFLGSTAARVVRHATCSVHVVR